MRKDGRGRDHKMSEIRVAIAGAKGRMGTGSRQDGDERTTVYIRTGN